MAGCGKKTEADSAAAPKPAAPVQVQKAEARDLTRSALYTGSVEPVTVARMASPAEGPIVECAVREGDAVRKNQRLVRVGRAGMVESSLEAAREEWKRQEADFKRVEQLVASGSLPGEQLEIARAALKRAEAQVAAAETGANDYDIHAPWAGIVSKVWVSEGNYVAPRAPLVEIYDPASLRVRFAVPEQDVRRLKTGIAVDVALDAWPDRKFAGTIERIYPQLDAATRTLTAEANLAAEEPLFSGLFARVAVPVETAAGAVVIPSGALLALPGGGAVVFVAQDEKASRRPVQTGLEAGGFVQILDGVAAGEAVIVRGQEGLKDGAPVKIMGPKKDGEPGKKAPAQAPEAAKP
ncbi:MAG TPA: efflux RND transporter periplasmic adaptor subunit [Kiritimatiellia bacterium]|nr:efflux RND transporter periplasmic adaptor subunit [Kiritimatiellia bacterium]